MTDTPHVWSYVWSAYGIAWTLMLSYGVFLFTREHGSAPPEDHH